MPGEEPIPTYPVTHYVTAYGAIGNGVADDTAAFKAALEDMEEGVLFVPPGDWR